LHRNATLQSGVPITLGEIFGEESHTLLQSEVPSHTHQAMANTGAATVSVPNANVLSATTPGAYITNPDAGTLLSLSAGTVGPTNGGQPHENRQPFRVMNACICLQGVFPSRN
jgi:microcystin-dependent protein